MTQDKDYVVGTHDEEIARLGLQHRVVAAAGQRCVAPRRLHGRPDAARRG